MWVDSVDTLRRLKRVLKKELEEIYDNYDLFRKFDDDWNLLLSFSDGRLVEVLLNKLLDKRIDQNLIEEQSLLVKKEERYFKPYHVIE